MMAVVLPSPIVRSIGPSATTSPWRRMTLRASKTGGGISLTYTASTPLASGYFGVVDVSRDPRDAFPAG
jgi:hypothetical protein